MRRTLAASHEVFGEPKRFRDALMTRTAELLQQAAGDDVTQPDGDGSVLMTLRSNRGGVDVHKRVRVHIDQGVEGEDVLRIPVRWRADPAPHPFPTFDGVIELLTLGNGRCELSLVGYYEPPLGPIGDAVDTIHTTTLDLTGNLTAYASYATISNPQVETDIEGNVQPEDELVNERGYGHNGWRDHGVDIAIV